MTSIEDPESFGDGDVILTIDLEPVVVAGGEIPSFRDLVLGIEGNDVAQYQEFLVRKGYDIPVDGKFGNSTRVATQDWQRSINAEPTGEVSRGMIHWVQHLPTAVQFADLVEGMPISETTPLFRVLSGEPEFWLPLGLDQRNLLPESPSLAIELSERQHVEAWLGTGVTADDGSRYLLNARDGGPLCPSPCSAIPYQEATPVPIRVTVVPPTTGTVIPVAALLTSPTGDSYVRSAAGEDLSVEVIAEDGGLVVVTGLRPGAVIELPGEPQQP